MNLRIRRFRQAPHGFRPNRLYANISVAVWHALLVEHRIHIAARERDKVSTGRDARRAFIAGIRREWNNTRRRLSVAGGEPQDRSESYKKHRDCRGDPPPLSAVRRGRWRRLRA